MEIMTLRKHIKRLQTIAKQHPKALDMPLIFASDEEGNSFDFVYYHADFMHYDADEGIADMSGEKEVNAICIN